MKHEAWREKMMKIGSRVKLTTTGEMGMITARCAGMWVVTLDGRMEGIMMPASHLVEAAPPPVTERDSWGRPRIVGGTS